MRKPKKPSLPWKPTKPEPPKHPDSVLTLAETKTIPEDMTFEDLLKLRATIDVSDDKLKINSTCDCDGSDYCCCGSTEIYFSYVISSENKNYDKELLSHYNKLNQYNDKLKQYDIDCKEYKENYKQYKIENAEYKQQLASFKAAKKQKELDKLQVKLEKLKKK
jgi:hypothetical protein